MRFKRWPRVEAFQETSRTRAAIALSQRRQRDRLPLLAELIAAAQPSIEAVIEERHQAWPKWQQEKRDDRASKWREARRQLAAFPLIMRHAIRRLWNDAPYPGDPSYFSDLLLQIERGRVDPFARAPWRPSDDEIAEGRRRLAIFALNRRASLDANFPRTTGCPVSATDRVTKIRSFGLVTAGDGG
jgi:hypothetical protein